MSDDPKRDFNYAVLKRHDPCLDKIIYTSSICDVYEFSTASENWEQIDCKGTLFLYSRIANDDYPYAVLVLNRQNAADFKLGVAPAARSLRSGRQPMEVDLQDTTIMVQVAADKVYGLWLFEKEDRQRVTNLIQWCITNGTA